MLSASSHPESCASSRPEDSIYIGTIVLAAVGLLFALICRFFILPARRIATRHGPELQRLLPSSMHAFKNRNPGMTDSEVELTSFLLMWVTFLIGCGILLDFEEGFWHPAALVLAAILPFAVIAFGWFWLAWQRPTRTAFLDEWDDEKLEDDLFYLADDSDQESQHTLI
ncbi:hypothetical protein CkaCkLH20_02070 [Colletotrichum karsti]|uniref:Uncharacterized protein n=1 Tax=Colletotrichum karsti TaxID=1095194 RepID=A0A9P6IGF9_9PEZI|nr:uncharacterized protein CkaCkLH20_02070 [Colletotrichum karsti]KAF9880116.1 hypothetical protein CkaCkLH20_02070 [Colletotrichum karsti]